MRKIAALLALPLLAAALLLWFSPRPELYPPSFSRLFEDRRGAVLRLTLSADEKYRLFTPLSRMPRELVESTLLYEDRYFYRHPGVNPLAVGRACLSMLGGSRRMGGSTITMQLARLVWKLDTTSIPGKLTQMARALQLERHFSKNEILEAYLNLAPYGANVEGAGAAALVWFHKRAEQLSLPESFALATVPQHPAARNPLAQKNKPWQRLYGLWRERYPNEPDYTPFFDRMQVFAPASLPFTAPHAVDSLLAGPLPEGVLRTTLDIGQQKIMERMVSQAVERGGLWGMRNASALLVHWPSGEIRALVGSADYFNEGIQGQVDGTRAPRSPGSTLKPFIYALALQNGLIHPQTILADSPRNFGAYQPENSDGQFRGPVSARQALQASRNIPAITLANNLPAPGLYGFLKQVVNLPYSEEHYGLALVLGGAEISMRDLAALYGTLAARGGWKPVSLLPRQPAPDKPLLMPEAAFVALDMLAAPTPRPMPVPLYWKTGTSNGLRDAWTAGVFGPYVLVVWVGNFNGSPNPGFTGLGAAAPLFFNMAHALAIHEPLRDEARRDISGLNLRKLDVCAATGDINTGLCRDVVSTWFIPGASPIRDSGILRPIWVDKESGLRQCMEIPGRTEQVVWEFWPSDLKRLFRQAGIVKPEPPAWAPGCEGDGRGAPPIILSPKAGLAYARRLDQKLEIPLSAVAEAGVSSLFWFAGSSFLGRAGPEETLFWEPGPGIHTLRVLDDAGRSSSLTVTVEATP